jgi:hypothetical protein
MVVAYIMAFMKLSWEKALELEQERRKMAQPNPGFIKLLARLDGEDKFINFSKELGSHDE